MVTAALNLDFDELGLADELAIHLKRIQVADHLDRLVARIPKPSVSSFAQLSKRIKAKGMRKHKDTEPFLQYLESADKYLKNRN